MDLRLIIHRGLTYLMTVALITSMVIVVGRTFLTGWRSQPFPSNRDLVLLGFALLLFLTTWGQQLIAVIFDRYLYRGRIDYSVALHNATHRLSHLLPPLELATTIHDIAAQSFVPESFVMFVRNTTTAPFDCLLSSSMALQANHDQALQQLAEHLAGATSPSLMVLDPLQTGPNNALRDSLREVGVEVAMILGRRSNLLGVVFLGPRRSGDAYFAKDLTFLDSLTELASIALDNSLLYQQRIQMLEYSERLLESIDSAVVAVDVHGRITSVNNAAKSLLGTSDSARGLALDALPSEVGWALALTIRSSAVIGEVEAAVEHPNRGSLPLILSTAVLHDHENHISGALVVATDISAIKALERNQRRVEHFATMARFYAGLAHEIRSPLASISNFISMLPDRFDDPEYRDTASRLLPSEVARIVRLADRVRLMAPSEHGELKAVELVSLFSDIVTLHSPTAATLNIDIRLSCSADVPYIKGDPSQLVQLFTNLLNNAFEAMPSGGCIVIEVASQSLQTPHDTVRVSVIDEGLGIPAGIESRLFEPFFTTKSSGTGLGLSICREIADFHHARLALKRGRNGKGTVVEVSFPATPNAEIETRTLQSRLQPSTTGVESR
jgi:signal transduction histidine kinase